VADLGILVHEIGNLHRRLDATRQVQELPAPRTYEFMSSHREIPAVCLALAPGAVGQSYELNTTTEMWRDVPVRAESKLLEPE
jgi:hypothetical protein